MPYCPVLIYVQMTSCSQDMDPLPKGNLSIRYPTVRFWLWRLLIVAVWFYLICD